MTSPQQDHNETFAQQFVTLRTALGLTQAALAQQLGVTERAIQRWEAGTRSPKADTLKAFLALCIGQHAFRAGHEVEGARTLWKAAHLKVLFDQHWVHSLLDGQTLPLEQETYYGNQMPSSIAQRLNWGEEVSEVSFYGRESEQAQLVRWIREDRCRLIAVLGIGGIGKSALAVKLMHQLAPSINVAAFRSVRDAIPCEDLLADLIQVLAPQPIADVPSTLDARITLLLSLLQTRRCLVVLDNMETLFQQGEQAGMYRLGYEGYKRLLERIGTAQHQSCVVLTSREKPAELKALEGSRAPVRSLHLSGLDEAAGEQIVQEKQLRGDAQARQQLVTAYSGNPLALKIVAQTIRELFGSDIAAFLAEGRLIFQGVRALLAQQFARLTFLEQSVLRWLAIVREPTDVSRLLSLFVTPVPRLQLLEALEDLRRRSLIEHGQHRSLFTLQSVVMEFVTDELVKGVATEIHHNEPDALLTYGLSLASAKEFIRQTQERLIIAPTLLQLGATQPRKGAVEQQLLHSLELLRSYAQDEQGYGPANIIMLLNELKGNLQGMNLSKCVLRDAPLQGVQMQDTSLQRAFIRESTFTETFGIVTDVAVRNDGAYWATSSNTGDVRIFLGESSTIISVLHAHNSVPAIAFSPDGRLLATGGRDNLVKIWHTNHFSLLKTLNGHNHFIQGMAFSPDSARLATSCLDGMVYIWDLTSFELLHVLHSHEEGVSRVVWSPDGQIIASAGDDGIRLWNPLLGEAIRTLEDKGNAVYGLAFSPDSRFLASGGTDYLIKIWDVASGECLQSLKGHQATILPIKWSPDGHLLVSGSVDTAIYVWQTNPFSPRQVLLGHTNNIQGLAFTADGNRLFSASADYSARLWELASGQCVRLMKGYSLSCSTIAWNPQGDTIASGTTDAHVTLWNPAHEKPLRVLLGHTQTVYSVTWSPDGLMLASGSSDRTIRLWNTHTGECLAVLQDNMNVINCVAWSPNNHLLASGEYYGNTVRVWDVEKQQCLWIGTEHNGGVQGLSWSPDGAFLASGGDDSTVLLWKPEDGTLSKILQGFQEIVYGFAWSPDSKLLACCCGTKVLIWDVASETLISTLPLSARSVAIAWSPKGNRFLHGDWNGTLYWWETEDWTCLAVRKEHKDVILSISISPDGNTVASAGNNAGIVVWDIELAVPLHTLRPDRPYERVDITGIQGITEAQKATLRELGAVDN